MLSLRSFYRSVSDLNIGLQTSNNTNQNQSYRSTLLQHHTPGICDYLPQFCFHRQYFSIYIGGLSSQKVIHNILWNQYYQKTLLKEIYSQFLINSSGLKSSLIAKLDSVIQKNTQNQTIYMKINQKVYNLKDKLEYQTAKQLQQEIKQAHSVIVQKITQDGKWKKIVIDFGPYKNKTNYDIFFEGINEIEVKKESIRDEKSQPCDFESLKDNLALAQNIIFQNSDSKSTSIRKKSKTKKNSTQSERKPVQSIPNNSEKKVNFQSKQSLLHQTIVKNINSNSKSKISIPPTTAKSDFIKQSKKKSQGNSQNNAPPYQLNNQNSSSNKKVLASCSQFIQNENKTFRERNQNFSATSVQKNSSNFNQKFQSEEKAFRPETIDIKRQQLLKVKQNLAPTEGNRFIALESQIMKNFTNQQTKNNSVLSQILTKKEEIIQSQKRKIQEIQKKHSKQIEELKIKHIEQTESFKTEIQKILQEYSKKYNSQKEETKKLRNELSLINETLTGNKIIIAQLQIRSKFSEDENVKYKHQLQESKGKILEMERKYNDLVVSSKEKEDKLIGQKGQARLAAEKYLNKYLNLSKKLRTVVEQEQRQKLHE